MAKNKKNSRIRYYLTSYIVLAMPRFILSLWRRHLLRDVERRDDYGYICERVDYYCSLPSLGNEEKEAFAADTPTIGEQRVIKPKVYFLDFFTFARSFAKHLHYLICPGDVNYMPSKPAVVKSRPIVDDTRNATLMNMDKVRHFMFVDDSTPWTEKHDKVIFRGAISQCEGMEYKKNRYDFMQKFFDASFCDAGEIEQSGRCVREEWRKPKISIDAHLKYKFIMALEGNDVASNLKWVMSSSSIAVMPRPRFETWFMEGRLRADYHYIEIADDYSDLEEKLNYYINHPSEAQAIIENANRYVSQFRNRKREHIISLLVLDKYLKAVNR